MRNIPAWGWSIASVVVILCDLGLGAGGPAGRELSRVLFPVAVSLTLVTTLFSYMQQHMRSTRKLGMINAAAVMVIAFITLPFWHFGIVLPQTSGDAPMIRWWVNGLVVVLALLLHVVLGRLTRSLEPVAFAVEDKQDRLTI